MAANADDREKALKVLNNVESHTPLTVHNAVLDLRRNNPQMTDKALILPLLEYDDDMVVTAVLYSLTHVYGEIKDYRDLIMKLAANGNPRDTGEMPIQLSAVASLAELAPSDHEALQLLWHIADDSTVHKFPRSDAWEFIARLYGVEWKKKYSVEMEWDPECPRSKEIREQIRAAAAKSKFAETLVSSHFHATSVTTSPAASTPPSEISHETLVITTSPAASTHPRSEWERWISPLIKNEKDGSLLILVPGGNFLAGGPEANEGGGDPFEVELPPYYLGITPVTNAQYARFLSSQCPSKGKLRRWICLDSNCYIHQTGQEFEAYGNKADHPVVHVSWWGAQAYCDWASLRLPSELEWEKAARGVDGREYPWGDGWDQSKCRHNNNCGDEQTCGVWGYPEGCSPWGHYQMSGNVWEWCADWYAKDSYARYKTGDLSPPQSGSPRILRGGSWCDAYADCFRCACRFHVGPYHHFSFRVSKTVYPPAS